MPQVTVSLRKTNGESTATADSVGVNSNIQFATDVAGSVPNTCQKILTYAKSSGKNIFLDTYKINDLKRQFESLRNSLYNDKYPPGIPVTMTPEFADYLTLVENTQLPILRLAVSCLSEETKQDSATLKKAEQEMEAAKTRYELVDGNHDQVSYYESWFPIDRPVKETNLFILFGLSVFMLVVSILTFLQLAGIELNIIIPRLDLFGDFEFSFSDLQPYLIGGALASTIFMVFAIWRKWF